MACYEPRPAKTAAVVRIGAHGDAFWASSPVALLKEQGYHVTVYTAKTGGATSSIFALRFGEADGFAMGYGGPSPIQLETIGTLETKDATRYRVKSYCTPLLFSTLAVARLDGITDVAAVA